MAEAFCAVYGDIHLRLIPQSEGIVRVTRDLTGAFRAVGVSAVCSGASGTWTHAEEDKADVLSVPGLKVMVSKADGSLSFYREDGGLLLREKRDRPVELEPAEVILNRFDGSSEVRETMAADGARASAAPAERTVDRIGVRGRQFFELAEDEALYGLGSHEEGIGNLRGHTRLLYQHNLKAVVPVLVSTKGWGILLDMGCLMTFRDGGEGACLTVDCADSMDWYLLYGNGSYASLMERLRSLTGPAPLLPKYALGFTQSRERYTSAEELLDTAAEYRRRRVPLDMIVQDWMTWPEGQWGCKQPDRGRFPEGFAGQLHAMHVRLMFSIWPILQGGANPDREEMLREGCMLGNRSIYNAFLPKARALYWKQTRTLYREGVDAWWADCTEPFESDWHGHERPSDEERMIRNTEEAKTYLDPTQISLYSLCHSRGLYEGWRSEKNERRRALTVTRSSWAGQHRYAAVTWSGDVSAGWETLRRHIPEGLNFMAAGEPFWHCDIGGFFADTKDPWFWRGDFPKGKEDPGYRELFVRWAQYACFLTMMRAHGTDTPREIWQFGREGEPFYDALVKCIRMRYRLQAYQYVLMAETHERGLPALRIPALVFPEDPMLRKTGDTMMLGGSLLVCPVTRPMYYLPGGEKVEAPDENVQVYLPAGQRWYAAEGGPALEGGRYVTVKAPLDGVPVFVKAGTILPLSGVRQYTGEMPDEPVQLVVYPGADAELVWYEDDGITYRYEEGVYRRTMIRWDDAEHTLTLQAQQGTLAGCRRFAAGFCGRQDSREILYTGEAQQIRLMD